ncbi:hypothetical protein EON65_51960, partial [archaeon]
MRMNVFTYIYVCLTYPYPYTHSHSHSHSHTHTPSGATRFFTSYDTAHCQHYDVIPQTGSVLIFEHSMMHSGEVVAEGRKYAMRTDVQFLQDTG